MEIFEMKMQMRMQMTLMSDCFGDCVQSFRDTELSSGEKSCLQNCAKRTAGTMMLLGQAQ